MVTVTPPTIRPKIYLAGKITKDGWRNRLLISTPPPAVCSDDELFDLSLKHAEDWFDYVGPFFISCDHGCGHGPASHGAGATGDVVCLEGTAPGITPRRVFEINRQRIAIASHVFAFIDQTDCHGTLIELGMAVALGKHIAVTFGENLRFKDAKELWMARMCANCGVFEGHSVEQAWSVFQGNVLRRR
jgi:hypothetical protein